MEGEMNRDAELLDEILTEAPNALDGVPVTAKRIAHWTGLSVKTISDYRTGKLTIPTRVWREVLLHYRSTQVVDLLLGACVYDVVFHDRLPNLIDDHSALDATIKDLGLFHETQSYLADILRDGRIDEADEDRIRNYSKAYLDHRLSSAAMYRSVVSAYRSAVDATS